MLVLLQFKILLDSLFKQLGNCNIMGKMIKLSKFRLNDLNKIIIIKFEFDAHFQIKRFSNN